MMDIPEEIVIDVEKLTLGDLEAGEEIAGEGFRDAFTTGKVGAKVLVALLYVALRKERPEITLEDVRAMGLPVLAKLKITGADKANPTGAGGGKSRRASPRSATSSG